MDVSTGSICFCFCCCDEEEVVMLIRCSPKTDTVGAEREKDAAVPEVTKCDEAKARAGVKAADEKGEDVKASNDAAKREPSKALL
jgi:hypothetical protein